MVFSFFDHITKQLIGPTVQQSPNRTQNTTFC